MGTDVIDQLRAYLDYAGASAGETLVTRPDPASMPARWYRRGPVLAGVAALIVLILAVPAVLLSPNAVPPADEQLPDPLDLGINVAWPATGFPGDAVAVAAAFARLALGWTDFEIVSDPDAAADGPVWTTIQHPDREDLEVLSIPVGESRRALVQVGSGGLTAEPGEGGNGKELLFPRVPGATSAVVHLRFADSDQVEVLRADPSDIERGQVSVASESPIGGVVVVYLDEDGDTVTAVGGHIPYGSFGTGVIEVPASHTAHSLLAEGYPTDGSVQQGTVCAESGWRICLVADDGILAIVAFGNPDGTEVTLEGSIMPGGSITLPAAGETVAGVELPAADAIIVGDESPDGSVTATVMIDGEWAGELNGTFSENDS